MRDLGLIDVLHPDKLTPGALSRWLARDLGPCPCGRSRIDVGGLTRIPFLLAELLGITMPGAENASTKGSHADSPSHVPLVRAG